MKLRDHLAMAKTFTLTTKQTDGRVVEFTLKSKGVETVVYLVYGHVTIPKE